MAMKTIGQYLKDYPDALLKDYFNYLEKENERKIREDNNKRKKLLKSYTGKCFRVDINPENTLFFKVEENLSLTKTIFRANTYRVLKLPTNDFRIHLEYNNIISVGWLPNQEKWISNDFVNSIIISEESFNKVVKYYKTVAEIVNDLRSIKE